MTSCTWMQMSLKVGQVPKRRTVVETGNISTAIGLAKAIPSQMMLNYVAVKVQSSFVHSVFVCWSPLLWQRSGVIQMNDNLNAA